MEPETTNEIAQQTALLIKTKLTAIRLKWQDIHNPNTETDILNKMSVKKQQVGGQ